MAFGLFKKKNFADVIYKNGHVYTQDPDFPWASAVACKDGKVMAVGDFEVMDEIVGDETEVVDLNERFMFPGFIDVHGTPVLKAFEDLYMQIDPIWDLDTVLEMLEEYAEDCEEDIVFAYGYNESILADYEEPEDAAALLDEIESERPMLVLGTSGVHCWMNTAANSIVTAAAEDEGLEFVPADFILHVLSPIDFEAAEQKIHELTEELTDKGITSVLDLCSPDYFSSVYRNCLIAMIGENATLRQRFFGSLYINRPINPEFISYKLSSARTNCTELDGMINYDFLKLEVSADEDLAYFSQDALNTICQSAADKGYNIHLDALDRESEEMAGETFELLRSKGCRHNTLVLASDNAEEAAAESDAFLATWPTDLLNQSVFTHSETVSDAIDNLTVNAAELLGKSAELGSIEQGKTADFTVFDENPFDHDLKYFSGMHADMTIIDSLVVYDVEEENAKEMYNLLCGMQL